MSRRPKSDTRLGDEVVDWSARHHQFVSATRLKNALRKLDGPIAERSEEGEYEVVRDKGEPDPVHVQSGVTRCEWLQTGPSAWVSDEA